LHGGFFDAPLEKGLPKMDQVDLQISENAAKAMEFAFDEARARLTSMHQTFDPFTVTVVDGGLEVNDHPADSPSGVHESVKMLVAQDMPESYALCYDGWVDTDEGRLDAVIVEVADRGAAHAATLALLYHMDGGDYAFEAEYGYAGPSVPLYPGGTRPIVSGLAALQAEEGAAGVDADVEDELEAQ
jgi:hypothetical protein